MMHHDGVVMAELFSNLQSNVTLGEGALLLGGFVRGLEPGLLAGLAEVASAAPFRHMTTPGGCRMSVAMTNCGRLGWVTDGSGYRYEMVDPETKQPWPLMPALFSDLATRAAALAGFADFLPDACLINRYIPGSRLTLHQDRNEADFDAPIVSISLGLPATFLWGGLSRAERPRRMRLLHGDALVWGGPARMTFHGVDTLKDSGHSEAGAVRYNLTFRRAG